MFLISQLAVLTGRQLSAMGKEGLYAEDRTEVYTGSGTGLDNLYSREFLICSLAVFYVQNFDILINLRV